MAEVSIFTIGDYADIQNGNLYGMGIGWNWCYEAVPPLTLIARVLVAPSRLEAGNVSWVFSLIDSDGRAQAFPDDGKWSAVPSPTTSDGAFPGADVPLWILHRLPGFTLSPDRYQWRLDVDGATAAYPFTVVSPRP